MEFRTKIPLEPKGPKINYDSSIFLIGSCFVENIGKKLEYFKFKTLLNPFGILFHPVAIFNFLKKVEEQAEFTEADIFFHNETWHSFYAHSELNSVDKNKILDRLNLKVQEAAHFLKEVSHVILTPGTAWGYRSIDSGQVVANCHKLPQKHFQKNLLEVEEDLQASLDIIRKVNPSAAVIFTVSPVRHLKDGFVENQQSKAKLISAVHKVISSNDNAQYFPAYEIMMDELRDYRFYAEDMIHPNSVAIDYIWERFTETWIYSEAVDIMQKVESIQKGLSHRPFNEASEAHKKFRNNLQEKVKELQQNYPQIRF